MTIFTVCSAIGGCA